MARPGTAPCNPSVPYGVQVASTKQSRRSGEWADAGRADRDGGDSGHPGLSFCSAVTLPGEARKGKRTTRRFVLSVLFQGGQRFYGEAIAILRQPQIIDRLQVHPELRRCAKEVPEPYRSVGSDIALTFQDLRNAIGGHIDFPSAKAAALMDSACKLLLQVFAGCISEQSHVSLPSGHQLSRHPRPWSSLGPTRTNPPLIVDADAAPSFSFALERLKAIARQGGEVGEQNRCIQAIEFAERAARQIR